MTCATRRGSPSRPYWRQYVDGLEQAARPGGRRGGEEAVAPAGDAFERGGPEAAEQHLGARGAGGCRADRADAVAVRFAGPEAAHHRHLLVQAAAPGTQVGTRGPVVVVPAADAEAEDQAAPGHPVHGGRLLGHDPQLRP